MNGDQAVSLAYIVGSLVLVGSALAIRRLPLGSGLKMAAAWLLIFAGAFAAFALVDGLRGLGDRHQVVAEPAVQGGPVRIQRDSDGHYWVNARVNDEIVRFLIDSGATVTVISKETAERAGVELDADFPVAVNSANGTVFMKRAKAAKLTIGGIQRTDFPVWVAQSDDDFNVLGMNFLSSLSSWGTEGGWLVLRP